MSEPPASSGRVSTSAHRRLDDVRLHQLERGSIGIAAGVASAQRAAGSSRRGAGRGETRLIVGGYVVYVSVLTAYLVTHGRFTPSPDLLIVGMLPLAFLMRRAKSFLFDWFPFVVLLLAYEQARALAYRFADGAHVAGVIQLEERLFGSPIPTLRLQAWMHPLAAAVLPWDVLASLLYVLHFVVPVAVAFWIWKGSRALYWKYVVGLLLVSYAGFITYALYPMAPPWLAADRGYLPHVQRIFVGTLQHFLLFHPLYSAFERIDSNPVAAMPSLHIAYPVYTFLVVCRLRRTRWLWLLLAYPLAVAWAVVYLGEHYVLDCIAGAGYGTAAFWLVWDGRQSAARVLARIFH